MLVCCPNLPVLGQILNSILPPTLGRSTKEAMVKAALDHPPYSLSSQMCIVGFAVDAHPTYKLSVSSRPVVVRVRGASSLTSESFHRVGAVSSPATGTSSSIGQPQRPPGARPRSTDLDRMFFAVSIRWREGRGLV